MKRLPLLVLLLGLGLLLARGRPATAVNDTLEQQVKEIAVQLRCPVCRNLSIADTPSKLGANMRAIIREQLQQGRTPEEIIAYFVSKYGKWILLEPEPRGFNLIVWWGPALGLLGGLVGIILVLRRWVRAAPPAATAPAASTPYLERVRRDLAHHTAPEEE